MNPELKAILAALWVLLMILGAVASAAYGWTIG